MELCQPSPGVCGGRQVVPTGGTIQGALRPSDLVLHSCQLSLRDAFTPVSCDLVFIQ